MEFTVQNKDSDNKNKYRTNDSDKCCEENMNV